MVQNYKAFPILDFRGGLSESKQPWLISEDAFQTLKNAFLKRGVLRKRLGYTEYGKFVNKVTGESVTDTNQSATHTLANIPIRSSAAGTVVITDSSGTPKTLTDDGNGGFTGDDNGSAINYTTGAITIEWDAVPTGPITVDYSYLPQNTIMGIENYFTNAGVNELLIFDTKRACKYNTVTNVFDAIGSADIWTGDNSKFFWAENFKEKLYVVNNNNRLKAYDGTSFTNVLVEYDTTGSGNELDTCMLIFVYKERLVLFRPTENGTLHPQRARWSAVNNPDDWTADEFVDAPTVDFIVAADFLGDDLVVWFETSIWVLKFTQSTTLPFRWEKIVDTDGASATFALNTFSNEQIGVGPTSIITTDGIDAFEINEKIPDAVLEFDSENFQYIYSVLIEEEGLSLISYPKIGSSVNDETLVLNYINNTWSKFDYGFHVYGFSTEQQDFTWDDVELTWDEIEFAWGDKSLQAGFPITLAGDATGTIYKLNDSGGDTGSAIDFDVKTKRLNPFVKKGFKSRLGWIDILFTSDADVSLTVEFFVDHHTTAYLTKTVDAVGTGEKVWKRIEACISTV